jgi:hypothetical protein
VDIMKDLPMGLDLRIIKVAFIGDRYKDLEEKLL